MGSPAKVHSHCRSYPTKSYILVILSGLMSPMVINAEQWMGGWLGLIEKCETFALDLHHKFVCWTSPENPERTNTDNWLWILFFSSADAETSPLFILEFRSNLGQQRCWLSRIQKIYVIDTWPNQTDKNIFSLTTPYHVELIWNGINFT